jgi:hypothetical protein
MKIAIGTKIESAEQWDALPMGSELKDGDGWIHTKIADSDNDIARSSYVVPEDPQHTGKFFQPWEFDTVLVSTPVTLQATLNELAIADAAATALAEEAEQLRLLYRYALSLLDEAGRAQVAGYFDGLKRP